MQKKSNIGNISVKTKKSVSSNRWIKRQINDFYVKEAKKQGYRSRAAYKLLEINEKFNILAPSDDYVIDLGSAPGGWCQVAADLTWKEGQNISKIIAIDLLPMKEIERVTFLQKDFLDEDIFGVINNLLTNQAQVGLVLSDMAANTTGHKHTDHLRIIDLATHALEFSLQILKPNGNFVMKFFQGGATKEILDKSKANFNKVKHFKPKSSRKESSEIYMVALGRK